MPAAHRHGDLRACGAATVVTNQGTVFVNGKLWAVEGDKNTHGNGDLIATGSTITIEGKRIIGHTPDLAIADDFGHVGADDQTAEGSGDVFVY